jgi:hypothetical protein
MALKLHLGSSNLLPGEVVRTVLQHANWPLVLHGQSGQFGLKQAWITKSPLKRDLDGKQIFDVNRDRAIILSTYPENMNSCKEANMPTASEAFPSKWLQSADLSGRSHLLTVKSVEVETVGQGQDAISKWVMSFRETKKRLILNKTNFLAAAMFLGPNSDNWVGGKIEVHPDRTTYQGKPVDCIRVRQPNGTSRLKSAEPPKAEEPTSSLGDGLEDEMPF